MKYIKLFENFDDDKISEFCDKHHIYDYTINDDHTIDIEQSVDIQLSDGIEELPFKINKVEGNFQIRSSNLTSMYNFPNEIDGDLNIYNSNIKNLDYLPIKFKNLNLFDNKITSLKGLPEHIHGDLTVNGNELTNLEHCPKIIDGSFNCSWNKITSLIGCPETINGWFWCHDNKLTTLEGGPKYIKGYYHFGENDIRTFEFLPKTFELFGYDYSPIGIILKLFMGNDIGKQFEENSDFKEILNLLSNSNFINRKQDSEKPRLSLRRLNNILEMYEKNLLDVDSDVYKILEEYYEIY